MAVVRRVGLTTARRICRHFSRHYPFTTNESPTGMARQRVSAPRRLAAGKASNYIQPLDAIRPGDAVVLACRVSTAKQAANLNDQEAALRDVVAERGATVVDVVRRVGRGSADEHDADWSGWLWQAANVARQHGAKVLAESTSRLLRHPAYNPKAWPDAQARESDLAELPLATEGVVLVTVEHPDAAPTAERSTQRKRGQLHKGRTGGRPAKAKPGDKKRRRELMLPKVLKLRTDGASLDTIAATLKLPRNTVARWLRTNG